MQLRPRSSGSAPPLEGEIHAVACEGFALDPTLRVCVPGGKGVGRRVSGELGSLGKR